MSIAERLDRWNALTIKARRNHCQNMIDATPMGRMRPATEDFFRHIVYQDPAIEQIWHKPNPSHLGKRDIRYLTVIADGVETSWSWNKACNRKMPRGEQRKDLSARNAVSLYVKPKYPRTACTDCGAAGEQLDHVNPTFKVLFAHLSLPLDEEPCPGLGRVLCGKSLEELLALHVGAKLEWVCKPCHYKRTASRKK